MREMLRRIKLFSRRKGKGVFRFGRVRRSRLGQPWGRSKGVSYRFPLEAVMGLYFGPMSLWTDQKRSMGLERWLGGQKQVLPPQRAKFGAQHLCLSVGA